MTLPVRTLIFVCFLLIFASSIEAKAAPCVPSDFFSHVFNARNDTKEWLSKVFQKKNIRDFDADLYFKSKLEYENMRTLKTPLTAPSVDEFEKYAAWMDTEVGGNFHGLPTIEKVLVDGTESQKRRLSKWMKKYSLKKLTDHQTKEAATDLTLILHNIRFDLGALYDNGAGELAKKMVKSQYHEKMIYDQLRFTMKEQGFFREANLLDRLKIMADSKLAKWSYLGGINAYFITNASTFGRMLLVTLPEKQIAKLSMNDLARLIEAGPDTPKFKSIVDEVVAGQSGPKGFGGGYGADVTKQVIYNTINTTITNICGLLWIQWGMEKYQERQEWKSDRNQKHQS